MIILTEDIKNWIKRADQSYGALTCPECYGEITKDKATDVYHCNFCNTFFSQDNISDLFLSYNRLRKRISKSVKNDIGTTNHTYYVIYAETTWDKDSALFKRHAGPAQYSLERDADKFTYEQMLKSIGRRGHYVWKAKEVKE